MRRILITQAVKDRADSYAKELLSSSGRYVTPVDSLKKLHTGIMSKYPKHAAYIQDIISGIEKIVRLLPNEFDSWYLSLNKWKATSAYKKAMSTKIRYNRTRKEFYKHVIDAMRYDRVQSHIMPSFIEQMNIRACVYCNSQYAVSTDKIKGRRYAHYELDHFKPKSQYPFLCVSFFNLQPSCSNCNKHKNDEVSLFGLYTEDKTKLEAFSFRFSPGSVIKYESSFNEEDLEIVLDAKDKNLLKNHEDRFYVSKLYRRFNKEASEILWLKKAYNPAFMSQVSVGFCSVFPGGTPDVETLYWGHDMNPESVHKRPLNKLAQDINNSI